MSTNDDMDLPERDFPRVAAALESLAERIDVQRYPGTVWRPGSGGPTIWIFRLLGVGAAAAVLLGAAAARWLATAPAPAHRPQRAAPQVASSPATAPAIAVTAGAGSLATGIDPAIASHVTWSVPRVTVPSTVDANGAGWSIPSISFPSLRAPTRQPMPSAASRPKST